MTQDIPPFQPILALPALLEILEVAPPASIHLVVVDPGVGSRRMALAGESDEFRFVFPDNGLPHALTRWLKNMKFFHLSDPESFGGLASPTFQGRDLFAPAVAALCRGRSASELGPEVRPCDLVSEAGLSGFAPEKLLVWNTDRFGNVLLGYRAFTPPDKVVVEGIGLPFPYVSRYQDVPRGRPGVLINSSGWLEIFCREGSAAQLTGLRTGMFVKATIEGGQGRRLLGES
ncbi:MAG: hypothetical protein D084_Lepto4C00020G0002 [Leptospirillum sp. Group IV 'UBA BS']|nr:MAG: hypothetical protein D084_Lepto4C00020G0002 [Leptospirillum sp. Group IV 'UBA BS']